MGIDFHSSKNSYSYTTRTADESWREAVKKLVPLKGIKILDVGCGGGIYTKALSLLGASEVVGIDFSKAAIKAARENCHEYKNTSFEHGSAYETGQQSGSYQVVLERALIHHLDDLTKCFEEACRVLEKNGIFIVQDRTLEDCLLEGNDHHIRGYIFSQFPELIEKERNRRHGSQAVKEALKDAGFTHVEEVKLWETRKIYEKKEQLLQDISDKIGRSILHEIDDQKLTTLVQFLDAKLPDGEIIEKDRWTIWKAVKE
ncbi:class I SAM-dependent methyltransferase [Jeotgalibacillus proteolyticus]|uniref:SAM-dependent methyltransferase n=1 Tax=Jeotgalibacillus proteolyticus TaxID=2082395 RepID=A0A2S5GFP1_9BACL|nr:class I SAM-dependent methyltransferase [Jeotgalibacillus proteolyticus]PPA71724.1 SAM-dependent methyltransferase [Jeotgalibacillus proteolyticus]